MREVAQRHVRAVALHPVREPGGRVRQDVGRAGRHEEDLGRPLGRPARALVPGGRAFRGLFQHDVGVGPREAEGGHGGQPGGRPQGPGGQLGGDEEAGAGRGDGRVPAAEMQVRRDGAALQAQHALDQSGDSGGRFQMPHVGLHRRQGAPARTVAVDLGEAGELDRVAHRGAGAVGLHHADVPRIDAGLPQGLQVQGGLRGHRGCRQPFGRTVLVGGRAAQHRQDPVTVPYGVAETFEHHDAAAFAPDEPVGVGVEGPAAAAGRQHAHPGEGPGDARLEAQGDTAGEREVALAGAQCLTCHVHGHQRGGTGGVQRHTRSLEAEQIGDPAGGHAMAVGQDRPFQFLRLAGQAVHVVAVADPGEDARRGAVHPVRWQAGVFQGLPGDFQQQAVLGVQDVGLAARDAEEGGVEARHLAQEAALTGGRCSAPRSRGVLGDEAPALRGQFAHRVPLLDQQVPQGRGRIGVAGEAASHADHGDLLCLSGG